MPELPEVETTRRGLLPVLEGHTLTRVEARVPALRFPLPERFAARLKGRRITTIRRRAKFLLMELDDGQVLVAHLGMSGRFRILKDPQADVERHDHVLLWTDAGYVVRFNDPRRFGFMDLVPRDALAKHPRLAELGPEPLAVDFTGPSLAVRLAGRSGPLKNALLDQTVVAGLGNIYACEALYWANLSPRRRAGTVRGKRADRLVAAIRRVLTEAIEAGGSSLRDFRHADGRLGYFQANFAVYDRAGRVCPRCADADDMECRIRRLTLASRSTFYCPRRQR